MIHETCSFPGPLVLASRSPRRAELLHAAGYRFIVDPADDAVEAGCCTDRGPDQLVAGLSLAKALDVARRPAWSGKHPAIVLGADTVAEVDGRILGKPVDESHARQMLQLLSGKKHRVLTGVSLVLAGQADPDMPLPCVTLVERTTLWMDPLTEEAIGEYLAGDLWIGKAGAFGYQDGLDWVRVVEGLESNVVGLPVERLPGLIRQLTGPDG